MTRDGPGPSKGATKVYKEVTKDSPEGAPDETFVPSDEAFAPWGKSGVASDQPFGLSYVNEIPSSNALGTSEAAAAARRWGRWRDAAYQTQP